MGVEKVRIIPKIHRTKHIARIERKSFDHSKKQCKTRINILKKNRKSVAKQVWVHLYTHLAYIIMCICSHNIHVLVLYPL